ncbi:hypothetical protein PENSPDRAFT_672090 [Peniophora sp. CONT]|nr:hypothetical protein PENSPDRAFT_672090 [Peniophora sp. CONT]
MANSHDWTLDLAHLVLNYDAPAPAVPSAAHPPNPSTALNAAISTASPSSTTDQLQSDTSDIPEESPGLAADSSILAPTRSSMSEPRLAPASAPSGVPPPSSALSVTHTPSINRALVGLQPANVLPAAEAAEGMPAAEAADVMPPDPMPSPWPKANIPLPSSPIEILESSLSPSPRRPRAKRTAVDTVIDLSSDEEDVNGMSGRISRLRHYPMPARVKEADPALRRPVAATHAAEGSFWKDYGTGGDFRQWVESVASLPNEPPTLPPAFGIMGPEMGWAHNAIYTRVVRDAKRAVSANELASRASSNLASTRTLIKDLGGLRKRLGRLVEPDTDSDSEVEPLPAMPPVPRVPALPQGPSLPPAPTAGPSTRPSRRATSSGGPLKRSRGSVGSGEGSGPAKKARRKTEG